MSNYDRGERGRPQQPPLPKPYDFVPLPEGRPQLSPPAGHHRYAEESLSGSLSAQIIARSPVHVASGILEQMPRDREYPLVKAMFRVGGTAAIPATSLKGCFRSIAEAITRSAIHVTGTYKKARRLDKKYLPDKDVNKLDIVQRIFGTLGYQGLVRFADALLTEGRTSTVPTPSLFAPHPESIDTYFDGERPYGRKFYMHGKLAKGNLPLEACDVGSRFKLELEFENLSKAELGLLLIALGLGEPKWWPKLGGGKPACLGTIEVIEPVITAYTPRTAYRDFEPTTAPQPIAPLIEAAHTIVLAEPAKKLADILRWPREDRECPHRNY